MFSQDVLAKDETGQKGDPAKKDEPAATDASLYEVEKALLGGSGDAMEANPLLEHIRTRVTDEGLIIEVFDIPGSPLFDGPSTSPNPIFERLVEMIGRVLARTTNAVAVSGHLATGDVSFAGPDPWSLSADRAQLTRRLLVASGVEGRAARPGDRQGRPRPGDRGQAARPAQPAGGDHAAPAVLGPSALVAPRMNRRNQAPDRLH